MMHLQEAEGRYAGGTSLLLIQSFWREQLDALKELLGRFGYNTLAATTGRDGLELADIEQPALIICDATMPDMSGADLCRLLRSNSNLFDAPILLLTEYRSDSLQVLECLKAGADDYLRMPCSPRTLISKIDKLVAQSVDCALLPGGSSPVLTLRGSVARQTADSSATLQVVGQAPPESRRDDAESPRLQNVDRMLEMVMGQTKALAFRYRTQPDAACEYVSPSVHRLTGYPASQFYADRELAWNIIYPDDRPLVTAAFHGAHSEATVFRIVRKDGSIAWIEARKSAVPGNEEGVELFEGIARDVGDQKQLEVRMNQSNNVMALGRLASGVAHDFNNLLTVILAQSSLVLDNVGPNQPWRRQIEDIVFAAEKAAMMTRQILAFSSGRSLTASVLNFNDLISEMQGMLERIVGDDIELVLQLSPDLQSVRVNAGQAIQVILNLAINARDAMPTGGKLVLATSSIILEDETATPALPPGLYVGLTVSDTGAGMDEQTGARVFEPFFTTKAGNSGLGLSGVYGIVKSCGGEVSVETQPGCGATFRLLIPVAAALRTAEEPAQQPEQHAPTAGTVLVVEDDALVRDVACAALELEGYRTMEAGSAAEAFEIYQPFPDHRSRVD